MARTSRATSRMSDRRLHPPQKQTPALKEILKSKLERELYSTRDIPEDENDRGARADAACGAPRLVGTNLVGGVMRRSRSWGVYEDSG